MNDWHKEQRMVIDYQLLTLMIWMLSLGE